MTYTIEYDAYDAGRYTTTQDEVNVSLNGAFVRAASAPSGWSAYKGTPVPPTTATDPGVGADSAPGWGSLWNHVGPAPLPNIIAGTNTILFTELDSHSSGIANIVIKKDGATVLSIQPPGLTPRNSGCGAGGNGLACACADCNNFNGPASFTFTFIGVAQPVPAFGFAPLNPIAGQAIILTGSATGGSSPYTFAWDFGDGGSGSGPSQSHTYAVGGNYNVTLTVTDSAGQSNTVSQTVSVQGASTLSITSTPSPLNFTINAQAATTPFSQGLPPGSYTLVMPASVVVGGVTYNFSSWSDGFLSATRVLNLTQNTSLQALYTGQGVTHLLTIQSNPSGVGITVNGVAQTTPYSASLPEAIYTVSVPASIAIGGISYNFQQWSNGTTSPAVAVSLLADVTLTATYTQTTLTPNLSVSTSPVAGVTFTLNGQNQTTPYTQTLPAGTYTIAMPATFTAGASTYNFKQWSDGITATSRTVNLQSDTVLSATYTQATGGGGIPTWELIVVGAGVAVMAGVGVYAVARKGRGGGAKTTRRASGPR